MTALIVHIRLSLEGEMNKSLTRRIIAITFSICGAGVMTYLSLQGSAEAFIALVAVVGTITGFYYGTQK